MRNLSAQEPWVDIWTHKDYPKTLVHQVANVTKVGQARYLPVWSNRLVGLLRLNVFGFIVNK